MPTKKPKPKGLRDIKNLPADRWKEVHPGISARSDFLSHDAPVGHYQIDSVAIEMARGNRFLIARSDIKHVRKARGMIEIAGASAIRHARADLSRSSRYEDVKNLYEHLRIIREAGRRVSIANPDELAAFLSREDDAFGVQADERDEESHSIASGSLEELLREAGALANKIDQQLSHYPVKQHQPSSAEPLTYYFMAFCAGFWHSFTGRPLDRNNQTDFQRFLVGGWQDLQLPDPVGRDGAIKPLEDHVRERLAKSDIFDHYGEV